MENLSSWLSQSLGIGFDIQRKLFESLVVVLLFWGIDRFLDVTIIARVKNPSARYQWKKGLGYLLSLLGVITIGLIWIEGMLFAATYLGLVSAGLTVALKDPIVNMIAWFFILWRRPFNIGDRVQIDEFTGDVIDIRIFQFSLMEIGNWVDADQSTGRILHVPNGLIFNSVVANFTHGTDYIWNEIPVVVTFESDWEKAKQIIQKIANDHNIAETSEAKKQFEAASSKFLLKYDKLTPIVYTSVTDSGVQLTIRYLCKARERRNNTSIMWESILKAFNAEKAIDLAYPTQRFYTLPTETQIKNEE